MEQLLQHAVVKWCKWFYSIPKNTHPAIDTTGEYSSLNQTDPDLWFLAGSFGNIVPIERRCVIPSGRAILFPIIEKEDSFTEDTDLKTESELIRRCSNAMDQVLHVEAALDGQGIKPQRILSPIFDLDFPENNVYDIQPGRTRSVCDGYWIFLEPLQRGRHYIEFMGEAVLEEVVARQERTDKVYDEIWANIDDNNTFRLDISYDIMVP
jgi:hypothetical protein